MFAIGEMVAACCDGKLTKAVEAKVIFTSPKGRKIGIRFKPFYDEQNGFIDVYFQGNSKGCSGFIGNYPNFGDYYKIFPLQEIKDQGYIVDSYDRPDFLEDKDEENRRL